jgi:uncharacterized membrane protein (UPF0136 family)
MNLPILATIAYGSIALIGGIAGYLKVQSKASLISGTISGLLLLLAAFLQFQSNAIGLTLAQAITAGLIIVFGVRLFKTRKFMPAGLMLLAGAVSLGMMF